MAKQKLVYDTTATATDQDNVGAYLKSAAGTLLTHTTHGAKERLDANLGVEYDRASAAGGTDRGAFILAVDNANNYAPLRVNADGALLVDVSVISGADKAEDSPHVSGDIGSFTLAVRQDVLSASAGTDGDYAAIKVDSVGALWAHISQIPAQDAPNTAINYEEINVTTTATPIPAAPLAARKTIRVSNRGNRPVFVGDASVLATDGYPIESGQEEEFLVGPGIALNAITAAGAVDVRIFEVA
jgi:hypothetical protein